MTGNKELSVIPETDADIQIFIADDEEITNVSVGTHQIHNSHYGVLKKGSYR